MKGEERRGPWGTASYVRYRLRHGSTGSGDGRYAPKPPLCKGRCRPCRAAEGLFPSGGYSRAASDYELLNSRAVRSETMCVAAIPQSATLTAPFTQRGPCAVRQCVPFPLAAQVRQCGQDMPQNGQITFQTFPWKWGKIATAGRGSPRGEAERKVLWALGAGRSNVSRKVGTKGLHPFAKAPAKS